MKVYTITGFPGHYPVGTSAVVVADSIGLAFRLLNRELEKHGLSGTSPEDCEFIELNTNEAHAKILQNGDY